MGRKKERYTGIALFILIGILAIGAIASGLDSSEIDEVCSTDNKIIRRLGGTWMCAEDNTTGGGNTYYNNTYNIYNGTNETAVLMLMQNGTIIRTNNITWVLKQISNTKNSSIQITIPQVTNLQSNLDTKFNVSGGVFTGEISMNLYNITNINQLVAPDGSAIKFGDSGIFTGIEQAINIQSNQTLGEGVISHVLTDMQGGRILEAWQVGKPESGGFHRNSDIVSSDFGITNGSILTSCTEMGDLWSFDTIVGCNTTESGASRITQGSERIGHSIYVGGGSKTQSYSQFINTSFQVLGNPADDIDLYNAPVHIRGGIFRANITIPAGKGELFKITWDGIITDLNPPPPFSQSGAMTGNENREWNTWNDVVCYSNPCVRAKGGNGGGIRGMDYNFSTINLSTIILSFWYGSDNMDSDVDEAFEVFTNNNEGSGWVSIWRNQSIGGDINPEVFLNFTLPSTMEDKTIVSLRFNHNADSISQESFVDNIMINGTFGSDTIVEKDVANSEIEFGINEVCKIEVDEITNTMTIGCSSDGLQNGTLILLGDVESQTIIETDIIVNHTLNINGTVLTGDGTDLYVNNEEVIVRNDLTINEVGLQRNITNLNKTFNLNRGNPNNSSIQITIPQVTGLNTALGLATANITTNRNAISTKLSNGSDVDIERLIVRKSAFFFGNITLSSMNNKVFNGSLQAQDVDGDVTVVINGTSGADQIFNTGGNVGIGTDDPDENLHIHQEAGNVALVVGSSGTQYGATLRLLTDDTTGTRDGWLFQALTSGDDNDFRIGEYIDDSFSEKFRIEHTTGNVGIGTDTPSKNLEIFTESGIESKLRLTQGTDNWDIGTDASSKRLDFKYGGDDKITVFDTGDVGIGNNDPIAKLDVFDGSDEDLIMILRGADKDTEYLGFGIQTGESIITAGGIGSTDNELVFKISPSGVETEAMRIDKDGNVGIGTAEPKHLLEAVGAVNTFPIVASAPLGSNEEVSIGLAGFPQGTSPVKAAISLTRKGSYGIGDMIFSVDPNADANDLHVISDAVMTLQGSTGNVGIGTDSPEGNLEVVETSGDARIYATTYDTTASDFSILTLRTSKGGSVGSPVETIDGDFLGRVDFLGVDSGSNFDIAGQITVKQNGASGAKVPGDMYLETYQAGGALNTNQLVLNTGGNVGIGTTNPDAKLKVDGTMNVTGNSLFGSNVVIGTPISASRKLLVGGTAQIQGNFDVASTTSNNYKMRVDVADDAKITLRTVGNSATVVLDANGDSYFNNGNVGIGTPSPNVALEVDGTSSFSGISLFGANVVMTKEVGDTAPLDSESNLVVKDSTAIEADVGGSITFTGKYTGSSYLSGAPFIKGYKLNAVDGDYDFGLKFGTRENGQALSTKMTIMGSGNVGIGTTTPTHELKCSRRC